MAGTRFTSWLGEDEHTALVKLAERESCSQNFIMRMAVRHLLFGAPIPSYLQQRETHEDRSATR